MASDITNKKMEMAQTDSGQILPEFAAGPQATGADDPFFQWLRDERSVRIGWSNYGIEKLQAKKPRKARAASIPKRPALSQISPVIKIVTNGRF